MKQTVSIFAPDINVASKSSAIQLWLNRKNQFFSSVLEEGVSNRQVLLLGHEYGRENFLKELAAKTDGGYDFVLLDCPPAVGLITVNALVAATDLIIPVQPEVASLYGLVSILDTVAVIQRKINRGLNLLGMLVTQYDRRTTLHAEILEAMRKQYGETVFSTVISRSIRVAESMSRKTDVVSYSRNSNGAADYRSLTREILSRLNMVDNK